MDSKIENIELIMDTFSEDISRIVIDNDSWATTKYTLINIDTGKTFFESSKYLRLNRCTINLDELEIPPFTQFKVKANVTGKDSTSPMVWRYVPDCNYTAFYRLTGSAFDTTLKFLSVESFAVNCAHLLLYNNALTGTKWKLYKLTGEVLFTSGEYDNNHYCTLDLAELGIPFDTKFKVKALVDNGPDATSSVILEYTRESYETAKFRLEGSVFETLLTFMGTL